MTAGAGLPGESCGGGDDGERGCRGKVRDSEIGNDDFGARDDADTAGRWLSPDWAAAAEAVPRASYGCPHTLNLTSWCVVRTGR